jgi:hypothetical protein
MLLYPLSVFGKCPWLVVLVLVLVLDFRAVFEDENEDEDDNNGQTFQTRSLQSTGSPGILDTPDSNNGALDRSVEGWRCLGPLK